MSKNAWLIFTGVCVLLLGGLVFLSNKNRIDVSNVDAVTILAGSEQSGSIGDHVFGKSDSKVIMIEYGDFQCPGCGNVHPTVKELTEKYKDKIAFVFRNLPITTIHPNARAAAAAAEAAGLQGKYWEMHNALYEDQAGWENLSANDRGGYFASLAEDQGLDAGRFKSDMESVNINQKINFDRALATKVGAEATPSFYLNGTKLEDETWNDAEKFEKALIDEMKKHNITPPKDN